MQVTLLVALLALGVFLAVYAGLHRRAGRPPIRWAWLVAILVLATVALVIGAV